MTEADSAAMLYCSICRPKFVPMNFGWKRMLVLIAANYGFEFSLPLITARAVQRWTRV